MALGFTFATTGDYTLRSAFKTYMLLVFLLSINTFICVLLILLTFLYIEYLREKKHKDISNGHLNKPNLLYEMLFHARFVLYHLVLNSLAKISKEA